MRFALVCFAILVIANLCNSEVINLKAKANGILDEYRTRFSNMKDDLVGVKDGLKTVAVHKIKSLGGQTLQAIVGAFANAFKGFDLMKILGKRDVKGFDYIWNLIQNATERLDMQLQNTFQQFEDVLQSFQHFTLPALRFHPSQIEQVATSHRIAVRGIISDTLNKGIDYLKQLYYKAKDGIIKIKDSLVGGSGSGKVVSDPVMVGRRSLLKDIWQKLSIKFNKIKQAAADKVHEASEVVNHISNVLGHFSKLMIEDATEQTSTKVQDSLWKLKEGLRDHLNKSQVSMDAFKQKVSDKLMSIINSEE